LISLEGFSDDDFRVTILRALRLLAVLTALGAALAWWKMGWRSAALLLVGAAISGSGLWEWLRLMTAVMARMDAGGKARPMGWVLVGFFLRLGLTVVVLYVSLKSLDGSVFALAAGLGLGIVSLTFEALRLLKAWTV
jgi:hypothetical protein